MKKFWLGFPYEKRMEMKEAPDEILEPIRRLVVMARARLLEGETDCLGRSHVYLTTDDVAFEISDVCANETVTDKAIWGKHGLFVSAIVLGQDNPPEVDIVEMIQMPRNPDAVSKENVFILRALFPESFEAAYKAIQTAKVISGEEWKALLPKLNPLVQG